MKLTASALEKKACSGLSNRGYLYPIPPLSPPVVLCFLNEGFSLACYAVLNLSLVLTESLSHILLERILFPKYVNAEHLASYRGKWTLAVTASSHVVGAECFLTVPTFLSVGR